MLEAAAAPGRDDTKQQPRSDPGANRIAGWILFVALAGAPLPFGSGEPLAAAFWCLLLGVALVFASPRHLRRAHLAILAGIAVIIVAFLFVLDEQISHRPWLATLHPIWTTTSTLVGRSMSPSASIVRDEP